MIRQFFDRVPLKHVLGGVLMLALITTVAGPKLLGAPDEGRNWKALDLPQSPLPVHETEVIALAKRQKEELIRQGARIDKVESAVTQLVKENRRWVDELGRSREEADRRLRRMEQARGMTKAQAEAYFQAQSRRLMDSQQSKMQQLNDKLARMAAAQQDAMQAQFDRMVKAQQQVMQHYTMTRQTAANLPPSPRAAPKPPRVLTQTVALPSPEVAALVAQPDIPRQYIRIPDRSVITGVVTTGVVAQAHRDPSPLTVVAEGYVDGPNQVRIPLDGCRVAAELSVEPVTKRAATQVTGLSCALPMPDGSVRPVEVEAKGWVTGPDNMSGMFVKVFTNDVQIMKEFGKAAIPTALASILENATDVSTSVSPLSGVVTRVGSDAVGHAAKRMADFYIDRAETLFDPVGWVADGQRVYVHFNGGVTLPIEAHELKPAVAATQRAFSRYRR